MRGARYETGTKGGASVPNAVTYLGIGDLSDRQANNSLEVTHICKSKIETVVRVAHSACLLLQCDVSVVAADEREAAERRSVGRGSSGERHDKPARTIGRLVAPARARANKDRHSSVYAIA